MKYNQEIAEKISQIHNIPTATLKTWQFRDSIPKKYFDTEGVVIEKVIENISNDDKFRILKIYRECEILNFAQITSVKPMRFADLERGKGTLTKQEYIDFKKELVDLKNSCQKLFTSKTYDMKLRELRKVLKDPRLKPYLLHTEKYVIECVVLRDSDIEVDDLEQIIINLGIMFQSFIL